MSHAPSLQALADRLAGYDPDALPVARAQAFIAELVPVVRAVERLALRDALGRVLAEDMVSPIDVPAHDNSAMDGYALRGSDLRDGEATTLRVVGTGLAGWRFDGAVPPGACVRITTGAVMPDGLDTVVPQELTTAHADGTVTLRAGAVRPGDHRRLRGEDLARGAAALTKGRVLRPAEWRGRADQGPGAAPGRPRPHRLVGPGRGAGPPPAARRLLLHRRRAALDRRAAARRLHLRQQPLHDLRHAQAPGRRHHRHGRGA
jgi:molybdopterin molybdotransferase